MDPRIQHLLSIWQLRIDARDKLAHGEAERGHYGRAAEVAIDAMFLRMGSQFIEEAAVQGRLTAADYEQAERFLKSQREQPPEVQNEG